MIWEIKGFPTLKEIEYVQGWNNYLHQKDWKWSVCMSSIYWQYHPWINTSIFFEEFGEKMTQEFQISMIGGLRYFHGLRIKQIKNVTFVSQEKNISNIYWINLGWLKPNQYTHIVHAPPLVVANLVTRLNGSNTTRASNDDRMQPSPLRHQHCHMQMLSLNQQCRGSGIGGSGPHQKR